MQIHAFGTPQEKRPGVLGIVFILWLSLAFAGMLGLWLYGTAPGKEGNPPDRWPESSTLRRAARASTLLMFVHPKCACSRASISELAVLLAHTGGNLYAQVIFLQPPGKEDFWIHTDLWRAASALPGTVVIKDLCDREAVLFGAAVSGETMVYDATGNLRFHGGITGARGHAGDNDGCSAVESYANAGVTSMGGTPVFGCPLFNEPTSHAP